MSQPNITIVTSFFTWRLEKLNELLELKETIKTEKKIGPFKWRAELYQDEEEETESNCAPRLKFFIYREDIDGRYETYFHKYSCEVVVKNGEKSRNLFNYESPPRPLFLGDEFIIDQIPISRNLQFDFQIDLKRISVLPNERFEPKAMNSIEYKLNVIRDLHLLMENATNSDLSVFVNDNEFKIHEAIIAARSETLSTRLIGDFKSLPVSSNVIRKFLEFIYTGYFKADVKCDELKDLGCLFQKYELSEGVKMINQICAVKQNAIKLNLKIK